jgi:hypothetical protein
MPALNHPRIGLRWSCLVLCLSACARGRRTVAPQIDPGSAGLGRPGCRTDGPATSRWATRSGPAARQRSGAGPEDQSSARSRPSRRVLAELMDSRQYLSDSGSAIDTTQVNAVDLLQAHVRWNAGPLFTGGTHRIQIGRETLDLGNRRLVARNAYRNTINAFTGVDWLWTSDGGGSIRSFAFLPVQRLPDDAPSLLDNQYRRYPGLRPTVLRSACDLAPPDPRCAARGLLGWGCSRTPIRRAVTVGCIRSGAATSSPPNPETGTSRPRPHSNGAPHGPTPAVTRPRPHGLVAPERRWLYMAGPRNAAGGIPHRPGQR